jgi:hypothetical protein
MDIICRFNRDGCIDRSHFDRPWGRFPLAASTRVIGYWFFALVALIVFPILAITDIRGVGFLYGTSVTSVGSVHR